jgi:hypothetical protein
MNIAIIGTSTATMTTVTTACTRGTITTAIMIVVDEV